MENAPESITMAASAGFILWGLWIGFDVLVGVGLAAGGFVVAATVHIFQIRRYEPLSRPVVLNLPFVPVENRATEITLAPGLTVPHAR